jgi:hypothetical protein
VLGITGCWKGIQKYYANLALALLGRSAGADIASARALQKFMAYAQIFALADADICSVLRMKSAPLDRPSDFR